MHIHSVEQGAVGEWRGERAFKAIVPTSLHSRTRVARSCTASLDFFAILLTDVDLFFKIISEKRRDKKHLSSFF